LYAVIWILLALTAFVLCIREHALGGDALWPITASRALRVAALMSAVTIATFGLTLLEGLPRQLAADISGITDPPVDGVSPSFALVRDLFALAYMAPLLLVFVLGAFLIGIGSLMWSDRYASRLRAAGCILSVAGYLVWKTVLHGYTADVAVTVALAVAFLSLIASALHLRAGPFPPS
jgi:hypothetical protein